MPDRPKLGFIGLGNMGGPICRRLVDAGYRVAAFDRRPDALDGAVEGGAVAATTAAAAATGADIVLTSLPHPHHVQSVMGPEGGVLAAMDPGAVWVDLTTNRGAVLDALAATAPDIGVVDCPVTGAVDGARNGTLTLFLGGAPADVAVVRPVVDHLGLVIECGVRGTGNVTKLVTNQLWFVHAAALAEGFALGLANGVELGTLWEAIKHSVGDSFVARHDAPSIFAGHYDPSFTLDLCLKDLGLIEELQAAVGTELDMTDRARSVFERAAARYGTDVGELYVAKRIEDDAGIPMRLDGEWVAPWEA